MDDLDRPDIGPHVFEQIEVEMHDQDKRYWPQLLAMQMPTPVMELAFTVLAQPSPRAPQLPSRLSVILHSYAQSLFYVEASKYPPVDSRLRHWLTKLAERIESRIMRSVREIEAKAIMTSLAYHGVSESQMRQVIAEALQQMIASLHERNGRKSPFPLRPHPFSSRNRHLRHKAIAQKRSVERLLNRYCERRAGRRSIGQMRPMSPTIPQQTIFLVLETRPAQAGRN